MSYQAIVEIFAVFGLGTLVLANLRGLMGEMERTIATWRSLRREWRRDERQEERRDEPPDEH